MKSVTKITKIHGAKGKNEAKKQGQSLNQWCYIYYNNAFNWYLEFIFPHVISTIIQNLV